MVVGESPVEEVPARAHFTAGERGTDHMVQLGGGGVDHSAVEGVPGAAVEELPMQAHGAAGDGGQSSCPMACLVQPVHSAVPTGVGPRCLEFGQPWLRNTFLMILFTS